MKLTQLAILALTGSVLHAADAPQRLDAASDVMTWPESEPGVNPGRQSEVSGTAS